MRHFASPASLLSVFVLAGCSRGDSPTEPVAPDHPNSGIRYERRSDIHRAFLILAYAPICLRHPRHGMRRK